MSKKKDTVNLFSYLFHAAMRLDNFFEKLWEIIVGKWHNINKLLIL